MGVFIGPVGSVVFSQWVWFSKSEMSHWVWCLVLVWCLGPDPNTAVIVSSVWGWTVILALLVARARFVREELEWVWSCDHF